MIKLKSRIFLVKRKAHFVDEIDVVLDLIDVYLIDAIIHNEKVVMNIHLSWFLTGVI